MKSKIGPNTVFAWVFSGSLALVLSLAACAQATPVPAAPSQTPASANPAMPVASATPAYPGPEAPVASSTDNPPGEGASYAPQAGDENLARGSVFVEESGILVMESYPPQYVLHLTGNLPTPCHQLRAVVSGPDKAAKIDVALYSLSDPAAICAQVLKPFEVSIALGSYTEGRYVVTINGEQQVGEIAP